MLKKVICVPQNSFKLEETGLILQRVSREGNDII
jgi:hypothetical protein